MTDKTGIRNKKNNEKGVKKETDTKAENEKQEYQEKTVHNARTTIKGNKATMRNKGRAITVLIT